MSGTRTQKKVPMKSQRKAIVNNFHRAGTDRLLKNIWMTPDQWASHINDALPLAGAADAPPLAGAALPLSVGIQINCNNQHRAIRLDPERYINDALPLAGAIGDLPLTGAGLSLAGASLHLTDSIRINGKDLNCAIRYDLVLNLHDLYGKHNAEGIYHNKIPPPVGSSINCYQVRKKEEPSQDAIQNQGDTWSSRIFNTLTQRYGLAGFIGKGNDNRDNIATDTVVNMNEDILLPDKTSTFFLSDSAINLFLPKYGQTVAAEMKCQMNLFLAVARNEVPVDTVLEIYNAL